MDGEEGEKERKREEEREEAKGEESRENGITLTENEDWKGLHIEGVGGGREKEEAEEVEEMRGSERGESYLSVMGGGLVGNILEVRKRREREREWAKKFSALPYSLSFSTLSHSHFHPSHAVVV